MHTNSKETARADLTAIIEGLLKAEVEFILVGGLAAVVQGAPVTTMDVDIVHSRSSHNTAKLLTFLQSIDATYRRLDNVKIKPREEDLKGMGHSLFSTRLGPIDILAFIEEERTYEDLLKYTVSVEFRGYTMHVLNIEVLVELKRKSKDPKDKQRLIVLEETLRQLRKEPDVDFE